MVDGHLYSRVLVPRTYRNILGVVEVLRIIRIFPAEQKDEQNMSKVADDM
jgi:hypothetical protein